MKRQELSKVRSLRYVVYIGLLAALAACGGGGGGDVGGDVAGDVVGTVGGGEDSRPVEERKISVLPQKILLSCDQTIQLNAISGYSYAKNESFGWNSSDTQVAYVDASGIVTCAMPGSVEISATDGEVTGYAQVEFVKPIDGTVVAGRGASCGLTRLGEAYCWGLIPYDRAVYYEGNLTKPDSSIYPVRVAKDYRLRSISLGEDRSACAVATDGKLLCWSWQNNISEIPSDRKFISVELSPFYTFGSTFQGHAVALAEDGSIWAWGANDYGQLGDGTKQASLLPIQVDVDVKFKKVTAGYGFSCGLTVEGKAFCWGRNDGIQLGGHCTNTTNYDGITFCVPDIWESHVPIEVPGGFVLSDIDAGQNFVVAMAVDGYGYSWGSNGCGQLGIEENNNEPEIYSKTITRIASSEKLKSISAANYHASAITDSGYALRWGAFDASSASTNPKCLRDPSGGVVGPETSAPSVSTPLMVSGSDLGLYWVEEGYMHSISLDSSGNVRCWGVNVEGQCGSEYGVDSGLYYWSPFPAMPPDFSINAPESEPAFSGGSAALPIEVVRLGGFNINGVGGGDPVSLTASGSTGVSVSLHPPVITPESPTSLMALNVLEGVASGVQTITVEGSSNGMVRTADVVVPISSPGSQEALTCLRGEWRTLTCGESKQQSLLFNADGRGFFENPDCNNICEAMVLNYHYTVSGNTFTLHYGTPDPVMCEGYGELPVSKPSQDDTLEFSCTDSRLSTTSSIGTEVYDKAVSQ